MKLMTDIIPRRDGTVTAEAGGQKWTFKADENGEMVCEVEGDEALAALLATGNFQPYDEADIGMAASLVSPAEGDDEHDTDDDGVEGEEAPGGLPIEAGTPPAAKPGRGRKAR
jgi:hypothetical protein